MQSNYGIRRDCEYLSKDGHHGGKTLRYDVLPLLHDVHVQIRVLVKMYSNAVTRCWSWSIKGALQIPITFKFVHGKWFWYQLEESSYFVQLPQPIFTLLHDVQDNGIGENVFKCIHTLLKIEVLKVHIPITFRFVHGKWFWYQKKAHILSITSANFYPCMMFKITVLVKMYSCIHSLLKIKVLKVHMWQVTTKGTLHAYIWTIMRFLQNPQEYQIKL